ncbi:UPF0739 protein C1orf74 homolog [Phaenicophaeus curvirostris]|uniref:UPF0739 protein C1orf74 homolog n=1 Tax=Phaenicophaeus curvirostris TaxID=33595 RepID=UPI0037F0DF68
MSGRLEALSAARGELSSGRKCRLPAGRALQLAGEVLAVAAGLKPALLYDCGAAGAAQWRRYLRRLREAGLVRGPLHVLGLGGSLLVLHPGLAQSRVGAVLCAHPAPFVDVSAARRSPALCGQEEAEAIRGHLAALLGHLRAVCPVSAGPASSSHAPCSPRASCSAPSIPTSSNPTSSNPIPSNDTYSSPASSFPASSNPPFSNAASSFPTSSDSASSNSKSSNPASSFPTSSDSASSNSKSSIPASSNPMPSNDVSSNPASFPTSSNPTCSVPISSIPVSSNPTSSNLMPSNNASSSPVSSHSTSSNPKPSNAASSSPASSRSAPSCPTSSNPASSSLASSSPVSSSEVVPTGWNLCTVVGVLLGYPAAYTFTAEEGGENCLAMTPLRVFTVQAACPRIKDGLMVQIYSFSIPESLCLELKEMLDAWREELKEAFRAQSDFVDLNISSEVVSLPAVAL